MSRIWDALRKAERERAGHSRPVGMVDGNATTAELEADKRLRICVPVSVYGHAPDNEPFYEETRALKVDSSIGVVMMALSVCRGQKLWLTNQSTQQEGECCVIDIGPIHEGKTAIGFKFTGTGSHFWRGTASYPLD